MTEQIRVDDVVTTIMYGLHSVIEEQQRMEEAKAVLYMTLSNLQIYKEETALSTQVDNTAEWANLFLASMVVRGCTNRSVEMYKRELRMFLGMINKAAQEITRGDIQGYLAHCKLVRHNKDVTINNKKRVLRQFFLWLFEEEYITANPMVRIRDSKVEQKVKDVFTEEQICIYKDVAYKHSIRNAAIVDFLHSTGVRISEMVALNRDDIDFQERQCIVYGKGRKERPVYLGVEASIHLGEYLESRTDDNPALFAGSRKPFNRLKDGGVRATLNAMTALDPRLEGLQVNPHKWRRQFVTDLLEKDVPLELVADMAGHNNLNTTKANYANYSAKKARDAHRKYLK